MYTPDNWIIIKLTTEEATFYKVLAGWSGGYLDGDAWRMNSGIEEVKESADYYDFIGNSGSVYRCYKGSETIRMNIAGVLAQLRKAHPDIVAVISFEDFNSEFNEQGEKEREHVK